MPTAKTAIWQRYSPSVVPSTKPPFSWPGRLPATVVTGVDARALGERHERVVHLHAAREVVLAVHEVRDERAMLRHLRDEAVPVVAVERHRLARDDREAPRRRVQPVEERKAAKHPSGALVLRDEGVLDADPPAARRRAGGRRGPCRRRRRGSRPGDTGGRSLPAHRVSEPPGLAEQQAEHHLRVAEEEGLEILRGEHDAVEWLTATTSEIDGSSKRIESSPNQSPRLSVIGLVDSNVVAVRSAS